MENRVNRVGVFALLLVVLALCIGAADDVYSTSSHGNISDPASLYEAITPSDSVDLTHISRGLYIGGAGDVTVISPPAPLGIGATVLWSAVPAGTILPIRVSRVKATGTTATTINALY